MTMKQIAPNYYPHFRCIADRCRHSCCIGWEIDVDEESLAKYAALPGELGEEIRASIVTGDECAHFRLAEHDRCPFLNEQGLCRMILGFGEDVLCQICRDHPRFVSEFSCRTEIGLGLTCEAAAQLILSQTAPLSLITLEDDGFEEEADEFETYLLALRGQLLGLLEDESWTLDERLGNILDLCGVALPEKSNAQWAEIYRSLERLDPAWDAVLDTLTLPQKEPTTEWDRPFINLAAYFLYRHLPAALDDGEVALHAAFAVLSVRIVRRLFAAAPVQDMATLAELARLYSSEIEYSTENIDALLDVIGE